MEFVGLLGKDYLQQKAVECALGWIKMVQSIRRKMTESLLIFWYVLDSDETTTLDKILTFALISYLLIPYDFGPSVFYPWLGILDDGIAIAFVYKIVEKNTSKDIRAKVDATIEDWFGLSLTHIANK